MIHSLSDFLNKIAERIICLLLAAMTVVTFAQVVFRLIQGSLPWSEELSRYMMIYLTFLGLSVGVKRGTLIEIEAVMSLFSESCQRAVSVFVTVLNMAFYCVLIRYGLKIVDITLGQISPAMGVKMGYIYSAIVIGAILMLIHSIDQLMVTFGKKTAVNNNE